MVYRLWQQIYGGWSLLAGIYHMEIVSYINRNNNEEFV
ncbi:MAG: hypothetical protein JWN76_1933 [Chitinophagaceae bacterium]|nr:hypothetical protein [Chitinophagaceae bacterium]